MSQNGCAHDSGGSLDLLAPELGRASSAHFPLRQDDQSTLVATLTQFDQEASAPDLDVVRVGAESYQINGFELVIGHTMILSENRRYQSELLMTRIKAE